MEPISRQVATADPQGSAVKEALMAYKVTIVKTLEDWWGIDDLLEGRPVEEGQDEITALLLEDIMAVIENSTITIEETN